MRALVTAMALLLPACGTNATTVVLRVEGHEVEARVVRRVEDRRRGLQGVTSLGPNEGMLFLYREPGTRTIWMKGCKIDLDIAFIDARGRIQQIETLVAQEAGWPAEIARSRQPAMMVLEMPAGWFERNALGVGAEVFVPASVDVHDADP